MVILAFLLTNTSDMNTLELTSSCVKRGDEKTCSFRDVTESIVKRKISRLC